MRKKRVKGGDQHAISVRIDNELWEWLQDEANRNRLINEGINFIRQMRHAASGTIKEVDGNIYKKINRELWE